jgi:hypothetical protein
MWALSPGGSWPVLALTMCTPVQAFISTPVQRQQEQKSKRHVGCLDGPSPPAPHPHCGPSKPRSAERCGALRFWRSSHPSAPLPTIRGPSRNGPPVQLIKPLRAQCCTFLTEPRRSSRLYLFRSRWAVFVRGNVQSLHDASQMPAL